MGLKYGERGISEAMVPTESAGRHWGIRLTSRRGSWRWQELCVGGGVSRTAQNARVAAALAGSPPPTAAPEPPFSPTPSPPPHHPGVPSVRLCPAHTHLRRSSRSVRPPGAARYPEGGPSPDSVALPLPHPGAAGSAGPSCGQRAGGGVAGAGRGAAGAPRARTGRVVCPRAGGGAGAAWPLA